MTGRVYLERGQPVTVLARWAATAAPAAVSAVAWLRPPRPSAPRNVLIERADGSRVIRPFRGLRRVG
jgi:acetyl esterase